MLQIQTSYNLVTILAIVYECYKTFINQMYLADIVVKMNLRKEIKDVLPFKILRSNNYHTI